MTGAPSGRSSPRCAAPVGARRDAGPDRPAELLITSGRRPRLPAGAATTICWSCASPASTSARWRSRRSASWRSAAEFASGMIRTTFTATPRRHSVLAAKAAVVAALVLVTGLVTSLLAYVLGISLLSAARLHARPTATPASRPDRCAARRHRRLPRRARALQPRHRRDPAPHGRGDLDRPRAAVGAADRRLAAADGPRPEDRALLPDVRRARDPAHASSAPTTSRSPPAPASPCSAPTPPWRSAPGFWLVARRDA